MTPLNTLELTPPAIALLRSGTHSTSIEKTLLLCCSCNLYYAWADLASHNTDSDICPRCGSHHISTNAEAFLDELLDDATTSPCFTFFWKDGSRHVLPGHSPADDLSNAGFGAGATAALDFYTPGDNHSWQWSNQAWHPALQNSDLS